MVLDKQMAEKRTETISYRVPKSMALDIREVARTQNRSVSDLMFLFMRRELYECGTDEGNIYKVNNANRANSH